MIKRILSPLPLVLALAIAVSTSPADAQGRGNGNGNGKAKSAEARRGNEEARPALQRRENVDDRYDARTGTYDDGFYVRTDAQRQGCRPGDPDVARLVRIRCGVRHQRRELGQDCGFPTTARTPLL